MSRLSERFRFGCYLRSHMVEGVMNRSRGPCLLAHNVEVLADLAATPAPIETGL